MMDAEELRARIKDSYQSLRIGVTFQEAAETTVITPELLDHFASPDLGVHGLAAFRLEAFLSHGKNQPVPDAVLAAIADGLRNRLARALEPDDCDLPIALQLVSTGHFHVSELASLVSAMKEGNDFAVAAAAPALLPLIGEGFLQDYLVSTKLYETGGMGGPQRPLLREMAQEALGNFKHRRGANIEAGKINMSQRKGGDSSLPRDSRLDARGEGAESSRSRETMQYGEPIPILGLACVSMVIADLAIYLELYQMRGTWADVALSFVIMHLPIAGFLVHFFASVHGVKWVFEEDGIQVFRHGRAKRHIRFDDIVGLWGTGHIRTRHGLVWIPFSTPLTRAIMRSINSRIKKNTV